MTPLECPQCFSYRVAILDTKPPSARCADCQAMYPIRYSHVEAHQADQPPPRKSKRKGDKRPIIPGRSPTPAEVGPLTEYVTNTIKGGPKALRAAQREANRLARKFGIDFQASWLLETPWLKDWAEGKHPLTKRQLERRVREGETLETVTRCDRPSRLRVRGVLAARARFLTFYAVLGTQKGAAKKARISFEDIAYQLKNDSDFMQQAEVAHAYFVDLLHTRAAQRAIEGDCEPVYWRGIEVGHIRKFDSRLQIEMLRAHMPNKFKTPGTAAQGPTISGDVFVLTEDQRARLMAANRERIMALPDSYLDAEFTKIDETPAAGVVRSSDNPETHEPQ